MNTHMNKDLQVCAFNLWILIKQNVWSKKKLTNTPSIFDYVQILMKNNN